MPSIEDFPLEVWLGIFEYLNIGDLLVLSKAYGEALSWLITQAGRKLVKKFLITAKLRLDSYVVCPEFQPPPKVPTLPLVSTPQECPLVFRRCCSRTLNSTNKPESTDSMTFKFPAGCAPGCTLHGFAFHPCINGTEPAVGLSLLSDFRSNVALADGSVEILRLVYRTDGHGCPSPKDDKVDNNGQTTRTISHRMPLCYFQWRTSTDPYYPKSTIPLLRTVAGVELPREWIDFLDDSIQVLIRFTKNTAWKHTLTSRPDFLCTYYMLDYFEADWTLRNGSRLGLPHETVVIEHGG